MEINVCIGVRLKEVREALALSQTEFAQIAEKAGVPGATRQSQAKYEKGLAMPGAAYLAAIAAAGADVLYILTGQRNGGAATDPAEQVLLDSYRRCSAPARTNLIQTAALLAAGIGVQTSTATPAPRRTTAKAAHSTTVIAKGAAAQAAGGDINNNKAGRKKGEP